MQAKGLPVELFLEESPEGLIIDVRAPLEYEKGHLPGAINIPLFENDERAEIGTLYKQNGKDNAVIRGLEIVSPKLISFVSRVKQLAENRKIFVYCFRGGMRSNSFAWLLNTAGLDAVILTGGYKAFRNLVLSFFAQKFNLVLLGGYTGSGKTEILKHLFASGFQSVDLEAIAHHKGSAFGAINEPEQPTQQNFEHHLFVAFSALDVSKTIVLEDESFAIGFNKLPYPLWLQMKQAPIVKIDVPLELRVDKLVEDYTTTDIDALKNSIIKISEKLGNDQAKICLLYLDEGRLAAVARKALLYYDKAYANLYQNKTQPIFAFASTTIDAARNAEKVAELINSLIKQ